MLGAWLVLRILVIGNSGAGKSTWARRLAARLGLPLWHLDQVYWGPSWQEPDPAAFERRVRDIAREPAWIIDGNFARTLPIRLASADAVVWLDLPTRVCLTGVLARWLRYRGHVRPDMAVGCPEKVDLDFLWYVATWRRKHGAGMWAALRHAELRGVTIYRLTTRAQIESLLESWPPAPS